MLQTSTLEVLRTVAAEEGFPGLYKGIQSQIVRTVLASALMLTVKERVSARTAVFLQVPPACVCPAGLLGQTSKHMAAEARG